MLYFIKDNVIHQYPVSPGCGAQYRQEQLRDTVPRDVQECQYCMREWPGNKDSAERANR